MPLFSFLSASSLGFLLSESDSSDVSGTNSRLKTFLTRLEVRLLLSGLALVSSFSFSSTLSAWSCLARLTTASILSSTELSRLILSASELLMLEVDASWMGVVSLEGNCMGGDAMLRSFALSLVSGLFSK